jgi:ribosomal protein S18 acetylase RimI-like enzyme
MERQVAIRPYCEDDEAWLFSLARSVFGERAYWRDRRTLDVLERDVVFVAEVRGTTAGYAALERGGDSVCIEHMLVSPDHDDEHVEIQLLAYAEGYAISVGARALHAVVEPDNGRAIAFYRQQGFVPVGRDLLELVLPQRP